MPRGFSRGLRFSFQSKSTRVHLPVLEGYKLISSWLMHAILSEMKSFSFSGKEFLYEKTKEIEGLNKEFQRQIQILVEDHRKEVDVIIFCFKLILSDVEGFSTDKWSIWRSSQPCAPAINRWQRHFLSFAYTPRSSSVWRWGSMEVWQTIFEPVANFCSLHNDKILQFLVATSGARGYKVFHNCSLRLSFLSLELNGEICRMRSRFRTTQVCPFGHEGTG